MIEIRDLRLALGALDGTAEGEARARRSLALRRLGLPPSSKAQVRLLRRSIDARGRQVRLVETVGVSLGDAAEEQRIAAKAAASDVAIAEPTVPRWPEARGSRVPSLRPYVIGAGVAGLFCALGLAHAGLAPVLVEQGSGCERRGRAIRRFYACGELDPLDNVQCGLGGAGAFSDGKLSTGTRDPSHELILQALVEAGAASDILTSAKPHVGSDVLPGVVEHLVAAIRELGGEVRLNTRLVGFTTAGAGAKRRIAAVELEHGGVRRSEPCEVLVLACGHSARDVFGLLERESVALEPKIFSMGVRVEHPQAEVDRALYGRFAGNPLLGAAPYKVVKRASSGLRCYSFCMCPGGAVLAAASEPGGVVTNGASERARSAPNANAALLVNVAPEDFGSPDPIAGVELQRSLERAAFELGGGTYAAPAQLVGDFLAGRPSEGPGSVVPSYPRGVTWTSLEGLLPRAITRTLRETLPAMARQLPFFGNPDAVLTALESRSSSPVRVPRRANLESVGVGGLYPVGEGAGWAGGIMSAAADGLKAARAIAQGA